jgi:hypothetical protein
MEDAAPHAQRAERPHFHTITTMGGNIHRKSNESPPKRSSLQTIGCKAHPSVTRVVFQRAFLRKKIIESDGTLSTRREYTHALIALERARIAMVAIEYC